MTPATKRKKLRTILDEAIVDRVQVQTPILTLLKFVVEELERMEKLLPGFARYYAASRFGLDFVRAQQERLRLFEEGTKQIYRYYQRTVR